MKKIGLISGWLISLASFAFGQDTTRHRILTFEQAVTMGLRNGVLLNTQRNNLELSQMQKVTSIVAAAPNINGTANVSQVNGNSFNTSTGTVINGLRDGITGSLSANLNLFSGFYRINSIRQYVNLLEGQSQFVNRTAQDLMNAVATQYLQVMQDVELLRIAKENWDILQKQLTQVHEQVELGAKGPVDEYNQAALAKTAELTYVQAEVALVNDKAILAQTILLDAFEDFETEAPRWDINEIGNEKLDADKMAEQAKLSRADYLRALKNEKGYEFGMRAACGLLLPNLTAYYNYGSQYYRQHDVPTMVPNYNTIQTIVADPTAASGYSIVNTTTQTLVPNQEYPQSFKQQFKLNNLYKSYGVQLNIPILNGFTNRINLATQRVLYENAVVTRQNAEYQIKNDIIRAVKNYDGARRAYVITADKLVYAQKALELETERFNLGVTSFVEYNNANKVFVQAQTDKAQAEYKLVFQKIVLGYAVGTLRPEDITRETP